MLDQAAPPVSSAVTQIITQREAEALSTPALAFRLFSALGRQPPQSISTSRVSGSAAWPPFIFSEVQFTAAAKSTAVNRICAIDSYTVTLTDVSAADRLGADAPRRVASLAERTGFHVLPLHSATCADYVPASAFEIVEAPSATAIAAALGELQNLAASPGSLTCEDGPCPPKALEAVRDAQPQGLFQVEVEPETSSARIADKWRVDFRSGSALGYWRLEYRVGPDGKAGDAKLGHVISIPF